LHENVLTAMSYALDVFYCESKTVLPSFVAEICCYTECTCGFNLTPIGAWAAPDQTKTIFVIPKHTKTSNNLINVRDSAFIKISGSF